MRCGVLQCVAVEERPQICGCWADYVLERVDQEPTRLESAGVLQCVKVSCGELQNCGSVANSICERVKGRLCTPRSVGVHVCV